MYIHICTPSGGLHETYTNKAKNHLLYLFPYQNFFKVPGDTGGTPRIMQKSVRKTYSKISCRDFATSVHSPKNFKILKFEIFHTNEFP